MPRACSHLESTLLPMCQTSSARELTLPRRGFQPVCITRLLNGATLSCMFTRVRTSCNFRGSTFTQDHPHFWHDLQVWGFPKPRYNNSPEGLRVYRMLLYSRLQFTMEKRNKIKISQVKRCIGQSPGGFKHMASSCPLSVESWKALTSPSYYMWCYTWDIVNQGSPLSFHWDTVTYYLCTWPLVSSCSRGKTDTIWPSDHHKSYCYTVWWSKMPGKKGHSFRQDIPVAKGRGQTSLWVMLILYYTAFYTGSLSS